MGFNFSFRLAEDRKDVSELEKALRQQPLNYPFFNDWVDRTKQEILAGWKKAILAFSDDVLVGDAIYQPHKTLKGIREIKNSRVHPKLQQRGFSYFMIKQAETHNPVEFNAIICDASSDNLQAASLLLMMGYEEIARVPLYDKNREEVVYMKKFERTPSGILIPIKNFISSQII
jgi:hypothetical protein